jgi:hypothetical protein
MVDTSDQVTYLNSDNDTICDKTITAHELGALATSWAYAAGVPLQEVLAAASWKYATNFTSHYFPTPGEADTRITSPRRSCGSRPHSGVK